jgi:preprotein translocase subunit YajC
MIEQFYSLLVLAADVGEKVTTAGATAEESSSGNPMFRILVPFILIFVVMYFFVIGPQRKREKTRRGMLDAVAKGDEVVTIGGVHGKVWQLKEQELVLKVDDNTKMTFSRAAIARVVKSKDDLTAKV